MGRGIVLVEFEVPKQLLFRCLEVLLDERLLPFPEITEICRLHDRVAALAEPYYSAYLADLQVPDPVLHRRIQGPYLHLPEITECCPGPLVDRPFSCDHRKGFPLLQF